jgi:hypothetical protein
MVQTNLPLEIWELVASYSTIEDIENLGLVSATMSYIERLYTNNISKDVPVPSRSVHKLLVRMACCRT